MRVQNINNQQSFKANACFIPPDAPMNLRRLCTTESFKRSIRAARFFLEDVAAEMKEVDLLEKIDMRKQLNAGDIIKNLLSAIKQGNIKHSKQVIVPPRYYTEARAFELNGDTLVLYSKPNHYDHSVGSSSKIVIEHVEDGLDKGTTHIFREYPERIDKEFDALAKALNELSE